MIHPTTRVLAVLELLQSHVRISGTELARRVDVDVRTLRRYIEVLEEIGIPITTERGRHGGYGLVGGFKLPPMMFTEDEALALSVGLLAARGLGLAEAALAVTSAQAKLARVMPNRLTRQVHAIADTIKIERARSTLSLSSNVALIVLTGAAQAQQRVRLSYVTARDVQTDREFDPYGLAFRSGAWYAVGMCHLRNGVRSFRLDRVKAVTMLELPFVRPLDFNALDHLTISIASMPRLIAIEVFLHADMKAAQDAFSLAFGLFEPVAGGVLLHSSADDLAWFARELARLPFDFEIRAPARLRMVMRAHASRLRKLAATARN